MGHHKERTLETDSMTGFKVLFRIHTHFKSRVPETWNLELGTDHTQRQSNQRKKPNQNKKPGGNKYSRTRKANSSKDCSTSQKQVSHVRDNVREEEGSDNSNSE